MADYVSISFPTEEGTNGYLAELANRKIQNGYSCIGNVVEVRLDIYNMLKAEGVNHDDKIIENIGMAYIARLTERD